MMQTTRNALEYEGVKGVIFVQELRQQLPYLLLLLTKDNFFNFFNFPICKN